MTQQSAKRLLADQICSSGRMYVLQGLLAKDPRARYSTAAEALEHRWLTGHACNDAATLKHTHIRAAALAAASSTPVCCYGLYLDCCSVNCKAFV